MPSGCWTTCVMAAGRAVCTTPTSLPRRPAAARSVNGVLGVSSWSYAYTNQTSRIFLREYVVVGQVPDPLAVAAYDAIWFLQASSTSKASIDAIREGLLSTPRVGQGTLPG